MGFQVIKYDPSKMLQKIAPETKIKKLLSSKVTLKKTALSFLDGADFIDKKNVADVALKTIKSYRQRIKDDPGGLNEETFVKNPAQLIQRVQNEVVLQISQSIKENYHGEFYTWLPSDADEPDPEHQLNYGKTFQIGVGEMPGERFGCKCGMEIKTNKTELEL